MHLSATLALLLAPALALSAAAQDAPRLDGSNVPQTSATQQNAPIQLPPMTPQAQAVQPIPQQTSQRAATSAAPLGRHKGKPSAASVAPAPVVLTPPPPPTPADLPPQAATVQFSGGQLTIHATNSSLTQILRDTSVQTGMQMEGAPEDQRIFGDFGPGTVSSVLGQLLDGGPSNYVLFGKNSNLAPRTLVITPKSSLAPGQVAGVAARPATVNNEEDDDEDAAPPVAVQPGVHALMPNRQNQDQPPGSPSVRTPQQIIDDLQRRRQNDMQPSPPQDTPVTQ
jgi:hypothetical protein